MKARSGNLDAGIPARLELKRGRNLEWNAELALRTVKIHVQEYPAANDPVFPGRDD